MIREGFGKTRAEVLFMEGSSFVQGIEAWVIPLTSELLVRITSGSNKTYYIEEEHKQKYYTHNSGERSFKKSELIFDKQAPSYGSEKKSLAEENKKERSYI